MSDNSNDKIKGLFNWCVSQTQGYKNVEIKNFTTSWKNGLGFCAILHRYGPELIDFGSLSPENIFENCDLAFNIAEKHFGIPSLLCPKDMVIMKSPDRLCMITYLSQYYNTLATKKPKSKDDQPHLLSSIENLNKETKVKEEKIMDDENNENNPNPPVSEERSENSVCAICSKTIYFLEKMTVADKFYHRSCYRQNQLTNLKLRNKTLERPTVPLSDQVNVSNSKDENSFSTRVERSSRSKLSPFNKSSPISQKPARPPSLDSNLSDKLKSSNNQSEDHSSQSASSINYISVNASSVESLSQNTSDLHDKTNENVHMFSNKLQPSSLDNSSNSLNSSFSKKRHAPPPPPPITKPRQNFLKPSINSRPVSNEAKVILYPEDLNPFADEEIKSNRSVSSDIDNSNPFAEYMTDENLNVASKPSVKPRKRIAPKLPVKSPVVTNSKSSEFIAPSNSMSDQNTNSSIPPPSNIYNANKIEIHTNSFVPPVSLNVKIEENKTENSHKDIKTDSIASSVDKSEKEIDQISIDSLPRKETDKITNIKLKPSINDENIQKNRKTSASPIKITKNSETISYDSENQTFPNDSIHSHSEKLEMQKSNSEEVLNEIGLSKQSVHKAPAPARPLPPKREVRGDTSYEFIPYESLYSQLEELNEKQSQIENEGRTLQTVLWETDQNGGNFQDVLQQWLDLVQKKNDLYSKEKELHEILKRQELEDRHADLEHELRCLLGKQESLKTAAEKAREEELINQILDTVNARAKLIEEQNEELISKYATNQPQKSKNTLRNFFSIKHRSSSVGKIRLIQNKTIKSKKKNTQESFITH